MPRFMNVQGKFVPHGLGPVKVLSVNSKKKANSKIQLDKLFKLENPQIAIYRRLGGLGDVLMTTPLCAAIKRLVPHCTLIYATDTEYASGGLKELVEHCPYVDKIISTGDINDKEYDYWVDVTSTGLVHEKAGTIPPNRIDMFADEAGVSVEDDPVPVYIVRPDEREKIAPEIKEFLSGTKRENVNIIGIQVRSNDARRTWPLDYMQKLIDKLAEDNKNRILIFDWGSTVNKWYSAKNVFTVLDRSIADTAAIIEQCDVIVCPDSYVLHQAGALNKKIVTIFGPIPAQSRINHYQNATVVQLDLPCLPCFYQPSCVRNNEQRKLHCLTDISPEMVYDAVLKKLIEEEKPLIDIKYGKDYTSTKQDQIILVKRTTKGIGDILMALTGIEALKAKYPKKEIHLAVPESLHKILSYNPKIDKLLDCTKPINARRYYMIADLSSPCSKYESERLARGKEVQKNRVEIFAEALGVRSLLPNLLPTYYVSDKEMNKAEKFFVKKVKNNKKVIFLSPSAAELYRTYPEYHLQQLIDQLNVNFNVLLNYLKDENKTYKNCTNISKISFREKMAIMSLCDGCITVDSAPLHVAAALKIPAIALFGPIDYRARCKGYKNTTVIISEQKCIPCWRNGDTKCKEVKENNPQTYSKCIEMISPIQLTKIAKNKFLKEE